MGGISVTTSVVAARLPNTEAEHLQQGTRERSHDLWLHRRTSKARSRRPPD
jgi:hypothetical protein